MKAQLLFLFTLLCSSGAFAQKWDRDKLDRYFDQLAEHELALGSVAIAQKGEIVYQRAFGFAGIEGGDTLWNTPQTQFRIGSITKTYTATMILKLAEEGKLSLADPLSQYFPQIPRAEEISLRQMLLHRSGLHNITDDSLFAQIMEQPQSRRQMLAMIGEAGSDFAPGERFAYSNSNYILLGYIAEDVSGKSYAQWLDELIVKPLGLRRTALGGKVNLAQNQAYSFQKLDQWQAATETDMSIPAGAGALIATPAEILAFLRALRRGEILSQAYADSMLPQGEQSFGMGLFPFPFYDQVLMGHTGGIDAYRASAAYDSEADYGVALCFNGAALAPNEVAIAMLSIFHGRDYDLPDFSIKLLDEELLQRYAGRYFHPQFPLDIDIRVKAGQLEAQATGQPSFILKAESDSSFSFSQAGIRLYFVPERAEMHFSQGGMKLVFQRQAGEEK